MAAAWRFIPRKEVFGFLAFTGLLRTAAVNQSCFWRRTQSAFRTRGLLMAGHCCTTPRDRRTFGRCSRLVVGAMAVRDCCLKVPLSMKPKHKSHPMDDGS